MFLMVSGTMRHVVNENELRALGDVVVARRVELGMPTTVALAKRMDMSSRVVSDIENGRRRVGRSTYAALEAALGWRRGAVQYMLRTGEEPTDEAPPHDDDSAEAADAGEAPAGDPQRLDVIDAVMADPYLLPEAKEHFLNQYVLLLRVHREDVSRGRDTTGPVTERRAPSLRSLPAVASGGAPEHAEQVARMAREIRARLDRERDQDGD